MITVRALLLFLVLAVFTELSPCQDSLRGTLITAMGNKQGIVVMTDSRASTSDGKGHFIPLPNYPPSRK